MRRSRDEIARGRAFSGDTQCGAGVCGYIECWVLAIAAQSGGGGIRVIVSAPVQLRAGGLALTLRPSSVFSGLFLCGGLFLAGRAEVSFGTVALSNFARKYVGPPTRQPGDVGCLCAKWPMSTPSAPRFITRTGRSKALPRRERRDLLP